MKTKSLLLLAALMSAIPACEEKNPDGPNTEPPVEEGYKIAGTQIEDFRIVYDVDETEGICKDAAMALRKAIKEYAQTDVQLYAHSSRETEHEILIGDCGRKENGSLQDGDSFDWQLKCVNGKLCIEGRSNWAVMGAAKALIDKYISLNTNVPADLELKGSCRNAYIFDKPAGTNLRLLDYNIWAYDKSTIPAGFYADGVLLYDPRNENRSRDFATVIKCTGPDVFAFQEYTSAMSERIEPLIVSKYMRCITSDSQWNWTPLFYNATTVTPKKVIYKLFEGAWSNSNSKSFTAALFTHKESGKDFIAIGTHLWWKSESAQAGSDNARLEQAELIIAQAREMLGSYDVPIFVMGDMNCKHASSAIQAFVADGYKSAAKDASEKKDGSRGYHSCSENGFAAETEEQLKDVNGDTAIDHILFKNCENKADVRYYTIIHSSFTYPMSDHAPRYVDVTLR